MQRYDYLIVGAELFGSVFAYKATQEGKKCLVIDRRPHLGGNLYCEHWQTRLYFQNWMHFISDRLYDFGNREQDVCLITCVFAYGSK